MGSKGSVCSPTQRVHEFGMCNDTWIHNLSDVSLIALFNSSSCLVFPVWPPSNVLFMTQRPRMPPQQMYMYHA